MTDRQIPERVWLRLYNDWERDIHGIVWSDRWWKGAKEYIRMNVHNKVAAACGQFAALADVIPPDWEYSRTIFELDGVRVTVADVLNARAALDRAEDGDE